VTLFWMNVRRVAHIVRVLAAHGLANLVARRSGSQPWLLRMFPLARLGGPERFRRLFEDLGGSFIKFGQMLALQPDIVSIAYCNELFNLLDRIPPFPFPEAERVVREELGRAPAEIFDQFETEPMSAASIGQVHIAWLNGRKVAVKIQRPSAEVEFAGDIRLIRFAMAAIRRLGLSSLYWALEPMSEFAAWTHEELDYRREARYADRLRRNAVNNPHERVPEIFWDLTTRRTLVMEYLPGITALDYLRAMSGDDSWLARKVGAREFDHDRFARHIIDNFVGDAFLHGVFHADLHPANLLVQPGEVVGYVDFGITGVLSRYSRRHLVAMVLTCVRADVDGMADAFFKLARSEADANPALFRSRLAEVSQEWYEIEGAGPVLKRNFTLVMLDMLILCRQTGITPERDVIKYIRSAVAADGLITPGARVQRRPLSRAVLRTAADRGGAPRAAVVGHVQLRPGVGCEPGRERRRADGDRAASPCRRRGDRVRRRHHRRGSRPAAATPDAAPRRSGGRARRADGAHRRPPVRWPERHHG
jgi:predicted unusual protein kinase regulating ubiquinone biosynthesis (AarF/ABC1/UbiB family)